MEQSDQHCPLVATGGPCTGKTVLLSYCAQQIKSWLPDSSPVVIPYFSNLSINTSPKHLLSSLCYQIASRYHSHSFLKQDPRFCLFTVPGDPYCVTNPRDYTSSCSPTFSLGSHQEPTREPDSDSSLNLRITPCPDPRGPNSGIIKPDISLSELKECLTFLLTLLPSPAQTLVLILDGLDQIENNSALQIIESLPSPLPSGVKLVLVVSSTRTHILQAIRLCYPQCSPPHYATEGSEKELGYACVQLRFADRKECVKMLASLMSNSGRRVTSGQQALGNRALTSCCLTLYIRLLYVHTSLWQSGMTNIDILCFCYSQQTP